MDTTMIQSENRVETVLEVTPAETEKDAPKSNTETLPLSKNQLKKRKRDEQWEAGREARKERRKVKNKAKKEEIRANRKQERQRQSNPADGVVPPEKRVKRSRSGLKFGNTVRLPISIVIDCSYDDLMMKHEQKSLSSQITRCYAENQKSPKKAHLAISSFTGALKERFDGLLAGQYRNWKGVHFLEEDFAVASAQARRWMQEDLEKTSPEKLETLEDFAIQDPGPEANSQVVYLSSDSDETLTKLEPHCVYIVGGLVDKNRHKGVCHRRAMDAGVRTAKLPIADYIDMNSRTVLTVNHVVEILLRWLEFRDWGKALVEVMPSRKGGTLKNDANSPTTETKDEESSAAVHIEKEQPDDSKVDLSRSGSEAVEKPDSLSIEKGPTESSDI